MPCRQSAHRGGRFVPVSLGRLCSGRGTGQSLGLDKGRCDKAQAQNDTDIGGFDQHVPHINKAQHLPSEQQDRSDADGRQDRGPGAGTHHVGLA